MNANKLFSEFSIKKIWDKLLQHDKAMNSTILVISSGTWEEQEDGTFKNTVSYKGFTENDKLNVDLYDDGSLSEKQLDEYEQYIDSFEIIDGALIAIANTKPTQSFTVVVKGDFEVIIQDMSDITSELNVKIDNCFQSVSNGKSLIASAITDKGIETEATDTFEIMAENIENISTGDDTSNATASESEIAKGYTAWVKGRLVEGTAILIDVASGYVILNSSDSTTGSELTGGWNPESFYAGVSPSTGHTLSTTVTSQTSNLISLKDATSISITYRFVNAGSSSGQYTNSSSINVWVKDNEGTTVASTSAVNSSKGFGTFTLTINTASLTGSYQIGFTLYSWGQKWQGTSGDGSIYKQTNCTHVYIDRVALQFK